MICWVFGILGLMMACIFNYLIFKNRHYPKSDLILMALGVFVIIFCSVWFIILAINN